MKFKLSMSSNSVKKVLGNRLLIFTFRMMCGANINQINQQNKICNENIH